MFRHEVRRIRLQSSLTPNDNTFWKYRITFCRKLLRNRSQAESKERRKTDTTFEFLIQKASWLSNDFSIEDTDQDH